MSEKKLHITHVLHRFDTGGLENGVVNLINHLDQRLYSHSIVTLKGYNPVFAARILSSNVEYFDLKKREGNDLGVFLRLNRLLKILKPDILHTRNTSALEMQLVGWWRRVPLRVHGEHGWDINDLKGQNWKYIILKKAMKRFIHKYIALSHEATNYIINVIKIDAKKVNRICNGVDTSKFNSLATSSIALPNGFIEKDSLVFGTVGRLAQVKNQGFLLEAFIHLLARFPDNANKLKLLIVGDGILMQKLAERCEQAKVSKNVCLFGNCGHVNEIMRLMDVFVLPSLAEGISNTFLEAMATGLPVIATNVGGNPDLMMPQHAKTHLVSVDDVESLVTSMEQYVINSDKLADDSRSVRQYCVDQFGIETMVDKYHHIYQSSNG